MNVFHLIQSVQVEGSVFFRLASGQEGDSHAGWEDGSRESHGCSEGDFLRGDVAPFRVGGPWSHHVRFVEHSFEEEVVVNERLVHCLVHSLGDFLAILDAVRAVAQNFRFDDRDQTVFLADGSVPGESPGVFVDGLLGWEVVFLVDFEDSSPFGEPDSHGVIFLGLLVEFVESGSPGLVVSAWQYLKTFVDFDSRNDAFFTQDFDEFFAGAIGLSCSFII